jgi:hypothetical protein
MKNKVKNSLDALQLSDVYSLMLFVMYKVQDVPEYAVLSELCYLLDGSNLARLLAYFAGKTVTFPTADDFVIVSNALLLYQYVNIEGDDMATAESKLSGLSAKQKSKVMALYLKLLPIMGQYNIDRSQIHKDDR